MGEKALGAFLAGLAGSASTLRARPERLRKKELDEISLREAEIDLETSKIQQQLAQFRLDLFPQDQESARQLQDAQIDGARARQRVSELNAQALVRRAEVEIPREATKEARAMASQQMQALKDIIEPMEESLAKIAPFNRDAVERILDFMGTSPDQLHDPQSVFQGIQRDLNTMARDAGVAFGYIPEDALSPFGLSEFNAAFTNRQKENARLVEINTHKEEALATNVLNLTEVVGSGALSPAEQALAEQELEQKRRALMQVQNETLQLLDQSGDIISGLSPLPRDREERFLTSQGGTTPSPSGPGGVQRNPLSRTAFTPPPPALELTAQGTPITDAVQLGYELATERGLGDLKAWLADLARNQTGELDDDEIQALSAIRLVRNSLENAPGTAFGGTERAPLELVLGRGLRGFGAAVPFGPFTQEALLDPGRFIETVRNGVKDPTTGQMVLPAVDGYSYELPPRLRKIALEAMTPDLRAVYDELDADSQRAMLITFAGSVGMGGESLSALSGTPLNPRKVQGVDLGLAIELFNPQGLIDNMSWVELATAGIAGMPRLAIAGATPILRLINGAVRTPFGKAKKAATGAKTAAGAVVRAGGQTKKEAEALKSFTEAMKAASRKTPAKPPPLPATGVGAFPSAPDIASGIPRLQGQLLGRQQGAELLQARPNELFQSMPGLLQQLNKAKTIPAAVPGLSLFPEENALGAHNIFGPPPQLPDFLSTAGAQAPGL